MTQEQRLLNVLVEFARTLGTDFSVESILDRLVHRVLDVLPVTGAGVMVMGENDELHFLAASDSTIEEIETLQNTFREGPCFDAYRRSEPVAIPDLTADRQYPSFSPHALEAGMAAVFTFPMRLDDRRLGALDLYRDRPGVLDDGDARTGQVLADVAAAYLFNAQARIDAAHHLTQSRHRSLHDPLTGLPNRTLLHELLERAVARAHRSHAKAAVLFFDLDRFKTVNDRYGHHVGDLLLTAVAARLQRSLRPGDTLARLAGDEFVIICEDLADPTQAELVAQRLADAFDEPFDIAGRPLEVSASVGIAFSGPGEDIPEALLRDADLAMYQAKAAGGAGYRVVDRAAVGEADHRAGLEGDLRTALRTGQLRLAYQPIFAAGSGALAGVEALLRWTHPEQGSVPPDVVIPLAERAGLIHPLGRWVLVHACTDFVRWRQRHGDTALDHLAVNVSAHQVVGPAFALTVADALRESGMDPTCLRLEVTETVLLDDADRARTVMNEVRETGVQFSLDDFGTGYSCLAYLRQFPFDHVKVDKSFVGGLTGEDLTTTRAMLETILALGRVLRLSVVAEGVETARQLRDVTDLGADYVQGYLLGRPLSAEALVTDVLEPAARARRATSRPATSSRPIARSSPGGVPSRPR